MSALLPCAACARHVRSEATACPFCGAARAASAETEAVFPRVPRAVWFAAGASLALAAGAGGFVATAHADTHEAVAMVPQYGAPSRYDPIPDPPTTPVTPDAGTSAPDAGPPAAVDAGSVRPRPSR